MSATSKAGAGKLWLLNCFGNAAVLAAWYCWLLIPDAHGWQVAGSIVCAVVVIFFILWLRAGTLGYFRVTEFRANRSIWPAFRRCLRNILPLLGWFVLLILCFWGLLMLRGYTGQFGVWSWQNLPGWLRLGSPRAMMHTADWVLWALIWIIVPAIWLPVASTIAGFGFRGNLIRSWRVLKQPMYWILFCIFIFLGAYIPYKLIWWIPEVNSLRAQSWSAGLRFLAAYLILTTAWILLLWMVGLRVEREDEAAPADVRESNNV